MTTDRPARCLTARPLEDPMTQPQPLDLDQIEARANAATPGPWGVYEYGGDSLIEIAADLEDTGCGYRARRTVCRFDEEPLDNDPTHREWTAEEDWAQVQADAAFIAAMSPETVKAMAAEIRRLRDRVTELEEERRLEWLTQGTTPHTPRLCACGHSHHAHRVPAPHGCFAHGQTCPCEAYQQLPHDEAVAQLKRNQQAAAERAAARP
jgi:hypothetical protein